MQESAENARFELLISLIREIKPSLSDVEISPEKSVVDDLGLDSLDLLQLSRRISRQNGYELDLESWSEDAGTHHMSVQSILDSLGTSTVA